MADSAGADRRDPEREPGQSDGYRFRRAVGLVSATAFPQTQQEHPERAAPPDTGRDAS
jgi:hypothetical protein